MLERLWGLANPQMFETNWVPSAAMAKVLGIHPQTLRKLRRHQITPFKEGRDYRWVGLSTSSTLQWHVHSASQAFTDFRRMPAEALETYAASRFDFSKGCLER